MVVLGARPPQSCSVWAMHTCWKCVHDVIDVRPWRVRAHIFSGLVSVDTEASDKGGNNNGTIVIVLWSSANSEIMCGRTHKSRGLGDSDLKVPGVICRLVCRQLCVYRMADGFDCIPVVYYGANFFLLHTCRGRPGGVCSSSVLPFPCPVAHIIGPLHYSPPFASTQI